MIDSPNFIALVLTFGCGVLVATIAIISQHWATHRQREMEFALKHEMIARGMSADEIERVLATRTLSQKQPKASHTGA